jgi:hypothetical protein
MRSRKLLTALLLAVTGTGLVPAGTASAQASVCGSLARCYVVARTDVDGDGRPDTVAIARRGADQAPHGSATVLVQTSPSRVESVTRSTTYWSGPLWQGAAHLDAVRGHELVFGATAGAHTEFFWAVTWRRGDLVTLPAPDGRRQWVVDGAANVVLGWQRSGADPAGLVRRRVARRDLSGRMTGRVTTYRWRDGRWSRVATRVVDPVPDRVAGRWVGWHVPGLDNY